MDQQSLQEQQLVALDPELKTIARKVWRGTLFWFVLVTTLLVGSSVFSVFRLRQAVATYAEDWVTVITDSLEQQLQITDALYRRLAMASVRVLQSKLVAFGAPNVSAMPIRVAGQWLPGLSFGSTSISSMGAVLDSVTKLTGSEASVIVKNDRQLIRVITTVRDTKSRLIT